MWYVYREGEMHMGLWRGNLKERDYLSGKRHRWGKNVEMCLKE
jgi:hypothetical protein